MKKFHKILKINKNSSREEIKKQYKKLAHNLHPDKGGSNRQFVNLNNAYKEAINYNDNAKNRKIIKIIGLITFIFATSIILNTLIKSRKGK